MARAYRCPTCRNQFSEKGEAFPFCCTRCKMVDLGHWAAERYVVKGRSEEAEDEDAVPGTRHESDEH